MCVCVSGFVYFVDDEVIFLVFIFLRNGLCVFQICQVIPQLSCPIALFTYYNPILRRGIENYMTIIKDAGVHGTPTFSSFLFNDQFLHHLHMFILSFCLIS